MRWLFAFGLVLLCSLEARAQASMDGWLRLPDILLTFERDHAECNDQTAPRRAGPLASFEIKDGKASDIRPVPPTSRQPSFTECMRSKGWVKP